MNSTEVNESGVESESEMVRNYTFTGFEDREVQGVSYYCRILDLEGQLESRGEGVYMWEGTPVDYTYQLTGTVAGELVVDEETMGLVRYDYNMTGTIAIDTQFFDSESETWTHSVSAYGRPYPMFGFPVARGSSFWYNGSVHTLERSYREGFNDDKPYQGEVTYNYSDSCGHSSDLEQVEAGPELPSFSSLPFTAVDNGGEGSMENDPPPGGTVETYYSPDVGFNVRQVMSQRYAGSGAYTKYSQEVLVDYSHRSPGPGIDLLTVSPSVIPNNGTTPARVRAEVSDPDGPLDIETVVLDLDDLSLPEVRLKEEEEGVFTANITVPPHVTPGDYSAALSVYDRAGNRASSPLNVKVGAWNHPPVITNLSSEPEPAAVDTPVSFRARVEDGDSLNDVQEVSIDLTPLDNTIHSMYDDGTHGDQVVGDGNYTLLYHIGGDVVPTSYVLGVNATDKKGGWTSGNMEITVLKALGGPKISNVSISPAQVPNDGMTNFTVEAEVQDPDGLDDIASVEACAMFLPYNISLMDRGTGPDEEAGDGRYTASINASTDAVPGRYNITVTALDKDGNDFSKSVTVDIVEARWPPEIVSLRIEPGNFSTKKEGEALLQAEVRDPNNDTAEVHADLSFAGLPTLRMMDDGTQGDEEAGDGIYALKFKVPEGLKEGNYQVNVTARDDQGLESTRGVPITVSAPVLPHGYDDWTVEDVEVREKEGEITVAGFTLYTVIFLLIIAVIALFLLYKGLRNRIMITMGLRNFYRHRAQTVLVVAGLLIGTTIISSAMITGESLDSSLTTDVYKDLGLTDITIESYQDGEYFDQAAYYHLAGDSRVAERTDGLSPLIVDYPLAVIDADQGTMRRGVSRRAFGSERLRLIGYNASADRAFGTFLTPNGSVDGTELGGDQVIMNKEAADMLNARVGDSLMLIVYQYAGESETDNISSLIGQIQGGNESAANLSMPAGVPDLGLGMVEVADICSSKGKGGYLGSANIFADLELLQNLYNRTGMINRIRVSNQGDKYSGVKGSQTTVNVIDRSLRSHAVEEGDLNITKELVVEPTKKRRLENAESGGAGFSGFLILMSGFTISAGALLIVNIFVMLAEERKSELGIERAIGMKKRHLVYQFMFEGVFYGLSATVIGTLLGILISWAMLTGFNAIFPGENTLISLDFDPLTPFYAAAWGFLLSFFVIILSSWRTSKVNIVSAIKNIHLAETEENRRLIIFFGSVMLLLGLLMSMVGFTNEPDSIGIMTLQFIGPSLAIMGGTMASRMFLGPRPSYTALGLGLLIWMAYFLRYGPEVEDDQGFSLLVAQGIFFVLSAVIVVMYNSDKLASAMDLFGRKRGTAAAVLKPAVSYPLHKKFRTGMTVGMFALVVFILVLFSIFFNLFQPDMASESGGYEIRGGVDFPVNSLEEINNSQSSLMMLAAATGNRSGMTGDFNLSGFISNQTTDEDPEEYIEKSDFVWEGTVYADDLVLEGYSYKQALNDQGWGEDIDFYPVSVKGIDRHFVDTNRFEFDSYMKKYSSGREAWQAALEDPSLVVVDRSYKTDFDGNTHHPGDRLSVREKNVTRNYTIVGFLDAMTFNGVFMSKSTLVEMVPMSQISTTILIRVKPGTDPGKVNDLLQEKYSIMGMNSAVFEEVYNEIFDLILSIFNMFRIFLGLGLITGFASLGVVAVRSTIERRKEIGMMRAVGFKKRLITLSFLVESLFITTLGVIIGIFTGYIAAYGIYMQTMQNFVDEFSVPWDQILMLMALIYAAAIIATIIPARRAAKMPIAEALRYYE